MNRVMKTAAASIALSLQKNMQKRASQGIFVLMSALCFLFVSNSAHAACGIFEGPSMHGAATLPMMKHAVPNLYVPFQDRISPIVGLWHTIYTTSDNNKFNESFDSWHDDGTEFESAFLAPAGGNVCAGVWKPTGYRSVALHHVGWMFNPSNPNATASNTFTLDEVITVSQDGATYSGTFTFKIWNLDGTPTPVEVTGTIAATRITVD